MRSNVALPLGLSLAIAAALAASPLSAQPVNASTTTTSAIAQGTPLSQALADLARGAKLQLVYQAKVTTGLVAPAVPSGMPVDQALRTLLQGSGLEYSFLNANTVVISAAKVPAAASKPTAKKKEATDLKQVTVTASKRVTPLQQIPGGISAVSGTALKEIGAQSNADYLGRLPGVVFNAGIPGQSTAVIRGVGTTAGIDQGQGPTGWYIDDVPLSEPSYAVGIPDIDTFDLQRVEVLRGPQGTLFGSASLGGAINYITNPADPSGFDAAFETGLSSTRNANGQLSYTAKGMINLPLIADRLALRAVVLKRSDAGYLDNNGTGEEGSTDVSTTGGRVSLMWTPDDVTRVSLMGLYQKSLTDDQNYAHSAQGKYARYSLFATEADYDISLFNGRLERSFDFGELTAILSQSRKTHELHGDVTQSSAVRTLLPGKAIDSTEYMDITMKTAEVRLASSSNERFEWLLGTMFSSSDRAVHTFTHADGAYAVLSKVRPAAEYDGSDNFNRTYSAGGGEEYAFFGEGNLHFNDAWTLTAGGRFFKSRYGVTLDRYGYSYVPSQHPEPYRISETGFVPKASLLYAPSRDFTTYATISKGFRVGNPNTVYPCECNFDTPTGWDSDSLWNYELGLRSDVFGGRGHVDAAVFYIDWSDMQVRLTRPDNVTYGTNAGAARIYGLEGSVGFDLTPDLNWNTNLTLLNAELTEDVATASPALRKGQQLPGASKIQVANTLTWRLPTALEPTLILSHRYISDAPETLSDSVAKVGEYNQIDLRLNLRHKQWDYSIWGTNLNNAYAASFGYGTSSYAIYRRQEFIIRPRTFGVSAAWHFN
jgi:outer membrane receptor protein involved in Fe transport